MDTIPVYSSAAGGLLCIFVLIRYLPNIATVIKYISLLMSKYFTYTYVLRRHQIIGPWSVAGIVVHLIYIAVNLFSLIFYSFFEISTMSKAGRRAGTLALVNMIPLFASPYLTFLADQLGVPLKIVRHLHRSASLMTFALGAFHAVVIAASRAPLPLGVAKNLFAIIGGSSLCGLVVLAYPLLRKPSYEIFLRTHQALAALFAYSMWRHLPSDQTFPRDYVYISVGLFLLMFVLQSGSVIIRNGIFRYHLPRATITHKYGAVKVRMQLRKPLKIDDGQYVNLWIPSVSFWSFAQSHPFMVISWAPGEQDTVDLLVEPRSGVTRELLRHAKEGGTMDRLVMFSGPHGTSVPMDEYETILMVASGFGIAAHLAHLKRLIYGYTAQDGLAAQSLLNNALAEDELDDGCILSISIYLESNDAPKVPFGERATVYPGTAPLPEIFLAEASGKYIKKSQVERAEIGEKALDRWESDKLGPEPEALESGNPERTARTGKMLVTVSGSEEIRDQLRSLVRGHLQEGVSSVELDYQPK